MPADLFAPVRRIDRALDRLLPPASRVPEKLHAAMRYSVFAGGKRLRPLLVHYAYRACGGRGTKELPAAAAVEMLHVYSLIHDDLPAMDDDDLRRGRPTLHKKYDEATAILAGDALLTRAFQVLADSYEPAIAAPLASALAGASATDGMIGGQALDLAAEGKRPSRAQVLEIHARKTAALIRGAVLMGGIVARAPARRLATLSDYGRALGLAFQIVDDILDETGDYRAMGKPVGRDMENGKMTFTRAVGIDVARREADFLVRRAVEALAPFGVRGNPLRELALFVTARRS